MGKENYKEKVWQEKKKSKTKAIQMDGVNIEYNNIFFALHLQQSTQSHGKQKFAVKKNKLHEERVRVLIKNWNFARFMDIINVESM